MYTVWWASSRSNSFQEKFFKTLYTFKHTIEQIMRSVKVHRNLGFKQKQRLAEKFFKTLYTFEHTIEQSMRSVKAHRMVGFKQKQWLPEEVFQIIIHIQTYNRTKYLLCESTLSGGLEAEAKVFRNSFSKQYTHSNIQLNEVCAQWKYSEWWASIRSNGFQTKFFETLYTFKNTIEQTMLSVKVHWGVGLKQKQQLAEEVFQNILHIQTYNWTKYALCECTLCGGLQAEAIGFRRNFSKHYTHSNTQYNKLCALWKYTETWVSSRSKGSRRSSLKHYTHSNIQLNKVCGLWKHTEWWASSRSNGFQKKFFKSLYTFKHTIEQNICSVKVHWVAGSKQKQRFSETLFQNNIHIQTYSWTKYALSESTVSDGLQSEAMAFRRSFSKHYTHSKIQLNKQCSLWKYTEVWAWSRSNNSQKKFFKTFYTFKHTIEQNLRSVNVHCVVGFKQKQ